MPGFGLSVSVYAAGEHVVEGHSTPPGSGEVPTGRRRRAVAALRVQSSADGRRHRRC